MKNTATAPDFPEWLNPILVKELRQGLRGKWFVAVFLWIQLSMVLLVGLRMLGGVSSSGSWSAALDMVLFYGNITLVLHVLIPFRNVFWKDEDVIPANMQLLQLTNISGRLAINKILASWFMIMLAVTAMLPYVLLRYFVDGMEMMWALNSMGWITVGAMACSFWGLFLSVISTVGRVLLGGGFLVFGFPLFEFGVWASIANSAKGPAELGSVATLWLVLSLMACFIPLALSDTKFQGDSLLHPNGPPTENPF